MFKVDQLQRFGDVASAASHDIGARNAIENCFCRSRGYVGSATTVTILAREMRLKVFSTKSRDVTSRGRKISLNSVEKMSIFNRIYRANIVTSGPRNTSKACFVQKLPIALLAPTSCLAKLAPHSLRDRDCVFQSQIPHQYRDSSVLARSRM